MERYLEAKGSNAHIELLQDAIRIKHRGFLGGTGEVNELPLTQVSSVRFKKPGLLGDGHIEFVLDNQESTRRSFRTSQESVTIYFDGRQAEAFEAVKEAVEQQIEGAPEPAAEALAETPAEASMVDSPGPAAMPVSKVAGGVEILGKKLRKLTEQNMGDDETVEFCLMSPSGVGGWSQAIVALDDRLLVIKPGMAAGATFGARVTSFYYRDITGIEVNTGLTQGVIEINTSSYQGTGQKDFWSVSTKDKNPFHVTNCLPIGKRDLKHYKPYIDRLRSMIREAKQEPPTSPPPQSGNSLRGSANRRVAYMSRNDGKAVKSL
jgi:Bacterial PH domain